MKKFSPFLECLLVLKSEDSEYSFFSQNYLKNNQIFISFSSTLLYIVNIGLYENYTFEHEKQNSHRVCNLILDNFIFNMKTDSA